MFARDWSCADFVLTFFSSPNQQQAPSSHRSMRALLQSIHRERTQHGGHFGNCNLSVLHSFTLDIFLLKLTFYSLVVATSRYSYAKISVLSRRASGKNITGFQRLLNLKLNWTILWTLTEKKHLTKYFCLLEIRQN